MKKIYYISGLGADERVFKYLNIPGAFVKHIKWEIPFKNETLINYSKRLISQIDLSDEVILIGVSFGGIIAQEIARNIKVDKIIIISSIKSKDEFDWKLRLISNLKIYKIVPASLLKLSNLFTADYYFGTESKSESILLKQIIKDTDSNFLQWAINEIMKWENITKENHIIYHIHGTEDRVFPVTNIKNAVLIKKGGHFMIVNRAGEISEIIINILNIQ